MSLIEHLIVLGAFVASFLACLVLRPPEESLRLRLLRKGSAHLILFGGMQGLIATVRRLLNVNLEPGGVLRTLPGFICGSAVVLVMFAVVLGGWFFVDWSNVRGR